MREIKFRAWEISEYGNEMYYVDLYWFEESMIQEWPADNNGPWVGNYVLMQYTGLKDKNGKEIYEGDVVFAEEYWGNSGKVFWNEGELQWWINRFHGNDEPLRSPFADGEVVFEVIGNIYENPELIVE